MMRTPLLAALIVTTAPLLAAPPIVTQTPEQVTVTSEHFTATFSAASGGTLSSLTTPDGALLTSGHAIYTDWGIYPERAYYGTGHAAAKLAAATQGDTVTVAAEGVLCDDQGQAPANPGAIAYMLRYRISQEPRIRIQWSATPGFSERV